MAIALNRDKVLFSGGHDPKSNNNKKHISITFDGVVVQLPDGNLSVECALDSNQQRQLIKSGLAAGDKVKLTLNYVKVG